jgi:hypothetical protein
VQFLKTNGKNAYRGILPFDRAVRLFGYYDKKNTQLSLVQRYQIEALPKAGMKQKMIAANIGINPSTVSRERCDFYFNLIN